MINLKVIFVVIGVINVKNFKNKESFKCAHACDLPTLLKKKFTLNIFFILFYLYMSLVLMFV